MHNKMKKEDLIIIVPGVKELDLFPKTIRRIALVISHYLKIFQPIKKTHFWHVVKYFRSANKRVVVVHWSRGFLKRDLNYGTKRLSHIINKYKNKYNIKIIGISLGGLITLKTLEKIKNVAISKVILLASPTPKTNINYPITNIYSLADGLQKFASSLYTPLDKTRELECKTGVNILLPKMTHEDLCNGNKIPFGKYKGKTSLELIEEFL